MKTHGDENMQNEVSLVKGEGFAILRRKVNSWMLALEGVEIAFSLFIEGSGGVGDDFAELFVEGVFGRVN